MTEYSGPFYFETGGSGDGWDEDEWMRMTTDQFADGLFREGNRCKVYANTPVAMNVLVSTGVAMVDGAWYENDAAKTLTITAANPTNPRIDRIVLRRTFSSPTSAVVAAVLTGTAAASPSAPALTQDATTWEISLCQVYVDAGAVSISQSAITDERDSAYCGFTGPSQLGQMYINTSGNLDASENKIVNLADCTANQDAATKAYVDTTVAAGDAAISSAYKKSCRVATTANITIATALNNGDVIDGVTLATGDRVLVKQQTSAAENGIYVVAASPSRATDFDSSVEILGALIPVYAGSRNAMTEWKVTNTSAITVGSTSIDISFNDCTYGLPPCTNPNLVFVQYGNSYEVDISFNLGIAPSSGSGFRACLSGNYSTGDPTYQFKVNGVTVGSPANIPSANNFTFADISGVTITKGDLIGINFAGRGATVATAAIFSWSVVP